jgi:hypothetical protein
MSCPPRTPVPGRSDLKYSHWLTTTAFALTVLGSSVHADHVGLPLPQFDVDGLTQTPAKSFDDFVGRTVLIEYFGLYGDTSNTAVPRLIELQDRFGARGLSVVGLTDWNKQLTEKWIPESGMKFAYGYDKGAKLKRLMGFVEWPQFFLVNPSGTIVWEGNWQKLTDADVVAALDGALTTPVWEWPGEARNVRSALAKHKYSEALTEAAKLSKPELAKSISDQLHGLIAARVRAMKSQLDLKDYLRAQDAATALAKEFEGLPELAEAKKTLEAIKSDKDSDRVIKGQKSVREINRSNPSTGKDLDKAIADLETLVKEYAGTSAERDGKVLLERLRVQKDPTALHKP